MNVNFYYTKVYNSKTAFRRIKNKPNSKPVLSAVEWANFKKAQNEQKPEKLTQLNLYRYISSTSLPTGRSFV